jgi:hypothetical protein
MGSSMYLLKGISKNIAKTKGKSAIILGNSDTFLINELIAKLPFDMILTVLLRNFCSLASFKT